MTGTNDCTRFDACLDLWIEDRSLLGPEQTQFFRSHLACCSRCSSQASVIEGLGSLEQDEESETPPLAQEALRRTFHRLTEKQHLQKSSLRLGAGWIWSVAGAAATVLLIIWMVWPAGTRTQPDGLMPHKTSTCCTLRVSQLEGNIGRNGQSIQVGDELTPGDRIQAQAGSVRLSLADESQVVVHKQTVLEIVQATERVQRFRMERGKVLFQVTPLAPGHSFVVDLKEGQIQVIGTIFEVNYASEGIGISVWEGKVSYTPTAGQQRIIPAGHGFRATLGVYSLSGHNALAVQSNVSPEDASADRSQVETSKKLSHQQRVERSPKPNQPRRKARAKTRRGRRFKKKKQARPDHRDPSQGQERDRDSARSRTSAYSPSRQTLGLNQATQSPRESMAALFDLARRLRTEGRWTEVIKTYKLIIRQYPASNEATTCLVLMGKVQLEKRKDAKAAIASFRQYLSLVNSGALVEETRWSLAAALRKVGDKQGEIRVLRSFVKHHPKSRFTSLAIKRLEALE